jgi:hypothetical protein
MEMYVFLGIPLVSRANLLSRLRLRVGGYDPNHVLRSIPSVPPFRITQVLAQ